ncbi:MAG: hypothetical protein JW736_10360 [Deltaproteobacteria bacterium]|nr:hypothetical protein [Deltaproteobacteria bacterium]MBN2687507.1 hypothetical protein [Deltaproteobacteria bacterium]
MRSEQPLNELVVIFQNLTQIESSKVDTNLSESYLLKSVTTELREIIMVCYLNTDLLTVGRYIKDECQGEYYSLVYSKIDDMKKNIDKNLKVIQSVSPYIKDSGSRRHIKNAIRHVDTLLLSISESMETFSTAKPHMH